MKIDSGDTAWLLASAALVLFMTPGLAFFYGGMVRSKNVLAMLMQNYVTIGLVSVVWAVVSYSLAFGADIGGGLLGGLHFAGLAHQGDPVPGLDTLTVPPLAFVAFQMMFAIITPALITGALADRVKFGGFVLFVALWSVFVYAPVAHWVFSPTGWLNKLGALDFAGGTVVHANAGAAALAVMLKFRFGFDDALDVVGVHLVGGMLGALLIGFLADGAVAGPKHKGLFYGGGFAQLGKQALAVVVVVAYSFVVSYILAKIVQATIGFRATDEEEVEGLDSSYHAETAYELGSSFTGAFSPAAPRHSELATADSSGGARKVEA